MKKERLSIFDFDLFYVREHKKEDWCIRQSNDRNPPNLGNGFLAGFFRRASNFRIIPIRPTSLVPEAIPGCPKLQGIAAIECAIPLAHSVGYGC